MWRLPIAYGLAVAGICAAVVTTHDPGIDLLRALIRVTAFTSSMAFLPAFTASSLHRLRPSAATRWLMVNRRYLGLSMAASHLWHLTAIVAVVLASPAFGESIPLVTILFGGLGFVLIAAMAATSNDASQRALGRNWGRLHVTGAYVIWLDFTFTYVGTALIAPFHLLMTLLFLTALFLRAAAAWSARRAVVTAA